MTTPESAPPLPPGPDAFDAYLERIRFEGFVGRNLRTLCSLHRAHLTQISYENLDIHFGRPLSLRVEDIYQKIVVEGRGGWCFEMNTLLRWALAEAGFNVTVIRGTAAFEGDHMLLCVEIGGERYLADTGWGNGFFEPLPLVAGVHTQGFRRFELTQDGDVWRFANLDFGDDAFTFTLAPRDSGDFADRAAWLQRDPSSSFVRVIKGFRFGALGELYMLRGAVLSTLSESGCVERVLESSGAYVEVWREVFRCPLSNVADLWPKVHADHLKWARGKGR